MCKMVMLTWIFFPKQFPCWNEKQVLLIYCYMFRHIILLYNSTPIPHYNARLNLSLQYCWMYRYVKFELSPLYYEHNICFQTIAPKYWHLTTLKFKRCACKLYKNLVNQLFCLFPKTDSWKKKEVKKTWCLQ